MKIILLIIIGLVQLCAFIRWLSCSHFRELFYFTKPQLMDRLLNSTNNDAGVPLLIIRSLHNKVTYAFWGGSQTFLQYWDIRFLISFISLIGGIGVMLSLWYLFTKKRKAWYLWLLLGFYSVFAAIELFFSPNINFVWKLFALGIPLQILSLFGFFFFFISFLGVENFCPMYIL